MGNLGLAENKQRKNLTDMESSKYTAQKAAHAKPDQVGPVSKGGRGKKGGRKAAAKITGISNTTIVRAEQHVAAGEKYPFLCDRRWKQAKPDNWALVI